MFPKSDLVVVVSAGRDAPRWLGVLQDLSAAGLIRDFVFVDADQAVSEAGRPCVAVGAGRSRFTRLTPELARRAVVSAVHVACVSELGADFSSVGHSRAGEIQREIGAALPAAHLTWLHAIAVTVPPAWPSVTGSDLAWVGAHNVVLAPENSMSPTAGVTPISARQRLQPVGLTHLAAALCSAAGMWAEDAQTPFNGEPTSGGGQLVALRTYSRHLDLDATQARLLARAVDLRDRYPVPSTSAGSPVQRVIDPEGAVRDVLDGLWGLHPDLRSSPRTSRPVVSPVEIGFLAAVRLFLRFMGQVVRGAPSAMMHALHQQVATRSAGIAQTALFGSGQSEYALTINGVRGVRADGTVAPPAEVDDSLDQLVARLSGDSGVTASERHAFPQLWKDFHDAAFTLLDGARRDESIPVPRRGAEDAVVTDPALVAPDPAVGFTVPPELRSILQVDEIKAYDADLARVAHELLGEQSETHRDKASAYQAIQEELQAWFEGPRASYVGQVGRRLSTELSRLRKEVLDLTDELGSIDSAAPFPDEWTAVQKSLGRTLLGATGAWLVVLVVVQFLAALDILPWRVALGSIPVIVLLWLISSTVIFSKRQRRLFQALHERRAAADAAATTKANLVAALGDLRRLRSIYAQYLQWARVLGTFLREPWGCVDVPDDRHRHLGEGFGLNHRFGVPQSDGAELDALARRLQSQLYRVGWLTQAWQAFVHDLPDFEYRHMVETNPALIYDNVAVSDRPLLDQWSEAVAATKRVDAAGTVDDAIRRILADSGRSGAGRLVAEVQVRDDNGRLVAATLSDFHAGLDSLAAGDSSSHGRFSSTMFADDLGDATAVAHTSVTEDLVGGRALIVTQVSATFSAHQLHAGRDATRRPGDAERTTTMPLPPEV